jgi:hypothetical protein
MRRHGIENFYYFLSAESPLHFESQSRIPHAKAQSNAKNIYKKEELWGFTFGHIRPRSILAGGKSGRNGALVVKSFNICE